MALHENRVAEIKGWLPDLDTKALRNAAWWMHRVELLSLVEAELAAREEAAR